MPCQGVETEFLCVPEPRGRAFCSWASGIWLCGDVLELCLATFPSALLANSLVLPFFQLQQHPPFLF